MKPFVSLSFFILVCCFFAGCGTPSGSAGYRGEPDGPLRDETHPASLIEVSFGPGETAVTKNIPEDAVHAVQNAVKSIRGQPVSEP